MNVRSATLMQLRDMDYDRYLLCLHSPQACRESLATLALFNVELAQIRAHVQDPLIGEMRLTWWLEAMIGLYGGRTQGHALLQAMQTAGVHNHVPQALMESMITARLNDVHDVVPATLADLSDYIDSTSGALQQAMCHVLCAGVPDAATLEAAELAGRAWGFVGLARAAPFHARQLRRYLPDEVLMAAGLAPAAYFDVAQSAALAPALRRLAEHGLEAVSRSRALRTQTCRCALPALLLACLAEDYAGRLAAADFVPAVGDVSAGALVRQLKLVWGSLSGRY